MQRHFQAFMRIRMGELIPMQSDIVSNLWYCNFVQEILIMFTLNLRHLWFVVYAKKKFQLCLDLMSLQSFMPVSGV